MYNIFCLDPLTKKLLLNDNPKHVGSVTNCRTGGHLRLYLFIFFLLFLALNHENNSRHEFIIPISIEKVVLHVFLDQLFKKLSLCVKLAAILAAILVAILEFLKFSMISSLK